jgi:16S rRNA G966 N2-methylase RsmD
LHSFAAISNRWASLPERKFSRSTHCAHAACSNRAALNPPYAEGGEYRRALEFLGSSNLVAPSGRIIAEYHRKHPPVDPISGLERVRIIEQGDAVLGFYRRVLPRD